MKIRDITVVVHRCSARCAGRCCGRRDRGRHGASVSLDRTFELHLGGKIEVRSTVPLKSRDDLSMAYTPGVARVCSAIHDDSERGLGAHDQGEHGRGDLRRDGRARARRHRPRGGDAGDGGQGAAVQGVRRRRRISALPGHHGRRRDRRHRHAALAPDVRRHQPGGHRRAALFRDRASVARGARHPGVPRRPARNRDRRSRGAAQRPARGRQARGGRADRRDGAGAAGMACTNIILAEGATNVIVCDIEGALYSGRPGLDPERAALAERTNRGREQGMAERAARGRRCLHRTVGPRCRRRRAPSAR